MGRKKCRDSSSSASSISFSSVSEDSCSSAPSSRDDDKCCDDHRKGSVYEPSVRSPAWRHRNLTMKRCRRSRSRDNDCCSRDSHRHRSRDSCCSDKSSRERCCDRDDCCRRRDCRRARKPCYSYYIDCDGHYRFTRDGKNIHFSRDSPFARPCLNDVPGQNCHSRRYWTDEYGNRHILAPGELASVLAAGTHAGGGVSPSSRIAETLQGVLDRHPNVRRIVDDVIRAEQSIFHPTAPLSGAGRMSPTPVQSVFSNNAAPGGQVHPCPTFPRPNPW